MREISKSYDGHFANKKVSFNLKHGTIHAIAGENGAGKSTLMKVLFGLTRPDSGEILIDNKKIFFSSPLEAIDSGIGMVQQHFALSGVVTALENIILGAEPQKLGIIDRKAAFEELQKIAGKDLEVPWNTETQDLAVGLQQRIEILKLLFRKAKILILDEPTGVLTPQEVQTFFELLRKMKSQGHSIVIITHKLDEIFSLCDEVTVLRQGVVTGQFEINKINKDQLIEAMIGRKLKNNPKPENKSVHNGAPLVQINNLVVKKIGRGSLNDITFDIKPGEILGVAGVEGNGQQALVESLLGLNSYEGDILFDGKNTKKENVRKKFNIGLISEDRHYQSLWLEESVANNCVIGLTEKFSKWGLLDFKKISAFAESILKKYEVKMQSFSQAVKGLSGGNQQKIVIAREVDGRKPKFLIASQPTRGVDVGAIEHIHQSLIDLAAGGSAILLISSELDEIFKLSDRIIVLRDGKLSASFTGPHYDAQKTGAAMI